MQLFLTETIYRSAMAGVLGILIAAPSPASAQTTPIQTPQAYCASLGNPSCEVLNIDVGGMTLVNAVAGMGIIKYCRNGQFSLIPVQEMVTEFSNGNNSTGTASLRLFGDLNANPPLPSTAYSSSVAGAAIPVHAFSNASLCTVLP
jgi:hypothetical protein